MNTYSLTATLDELLESKVLLSTRSYHVCLHNGLMNLEAILLYYGSKHSFLEFRNCGRKVELELTNLCKLVLEEGGCYYDRDSNSIKSHPLVIDQMNKERDLLQAMFADVCKQYNRTVDSIVSFIKSRRINELFQDERIVEKYRFWNELMLVYQQQAGQNSSLELNELMKPSLNVLSSMWKDYPQEALLADVIKLTPQKLIYLDYYYQDCLAQCTTRTRNGLKEYPSVTDLLDLCQVRSFKNLPNIGGKSECEINELFKQITPNAHSLIEENDDVVYLEIQKRKYPYLSACKEQVCEYYKTHQTLPLLLLMQAYFENEKEQKLQIFLKSFGVLGAAASREETAKEYGYSVERIRQIVKEQQHELASHSLFTEDWGRYTQLLEDEIVLDNDHAIAVLIEQEGLRLSAKNIMLILSYVSNYAYFLPVNYHLSVTMNHAYLIRKELLEIFDYHQFFRLFVDRNLAVDRVVNKEISIRELMIYSTYWLKGFQKQKLQSAVKVMTALLVQELHLEVLGKGVVVLPKNAEKQGPDIVYEILKKRNSPMHVSDILKCFIECAPHHRVKEEGQLRSILLLSADFVPIGKTSTYALKEWDLPVGSIQEIAAEYIARFDNPVDFDEIADYVQQNHPGKSRTSIRSILCYHAANQFSYFGDNLFGIAGKCYAPQYVATTVYGSWVAKDCATRFEELKRFVEANQRFPFSAGVPEQELVLYSWLRRSSVKGLPDVKLFVEQNKHLMFEKWAWEGLLKLRDLKTYVFANGHLPHSQSPLCVLWRRCQDGLSKEVNQEWRSLVNDIRTRLNQKEGMGSLFFFDED